MSSDSYPKVVYDRVMGVIDIRYVQRIVDTPEFQLLRDRMQLSLAQIAFPAARHTRLEHSLGSYRGTRVIANRWRRHGVVTEAESRALAAFALCHDIGHAPFSHATEDFCGDHKLRGEMIVQSLRPVIEASDIDFDLMFSMMCHEHPLHAAVSDKNIGIEKLDYLERDGVYTGIGKPAGIEYLRHYLCYIDGKIAIDEKMIGHVLDTMNFYMQMYKEVYLRKCCVIAQRMFHKMVHSTLCADETLSAEMVAGMTDSELIGTLLASRSAEVRYLYGRLRDRRLFKEAVVIRSAGVTRETRIAEKCINVHSVSNECMSQILASKMLKKSNHAGLRGMERDIAKTVGLEEKDILVVPVFYPERFSTQDVLLYGGGQLHSLRDRRPEFFRGMEEAARSYVALRVCTPEEYRKRLFEAAPDIASYIESNI